MRLPLLALLLPAIGLTAASAALPAQQFVAKRHHDLPRVPVSGFWTVGAATFDLGRDGDLDVLQRDGTVLENRGDGRFVERPAGSLLGPFSLVHEVLTADVDGDGDDDVLVVGGPTELYVQRADGSLAPAVQVLPGALGHDVELLDLEGDGDLDLVRGDGTLWRNDGVLPFVDATAQLPPGLPTNFRTLSADFDRDGDPDLLWGLGADVRVLSNDGRGTFLDVTPSAFPGGAPRLTRRSLLGDFDADGLVDLLYQPEVPVGVVDLRWNVGNGRFGSPVRTAIPQLSPEVSMAVFDADGDGADDLAISGMPLWRSLGSGGFLPDLRRQVPVGNPVPGDFDGDGDDDLFAAPWTVAWNEANASWTTVGESLTHGPGFAFPLDVDADGDLDLLANTRSLLVNDGRGHFALPGRESLPTLSEANYAAAVADFDGDGRDDVLLGAENVHLWLADGSGGLRGAQTVPVPVGQAVAVLTADADGDGDVDAVFSTVRPDGSFGIGLLRGDGAGALVEEVVAPVAARAVRAFTDLDGDGDPDLVTADSATWLNDGTGTFSFGATLGLQPLRTEAGDLDGDGDVDLFSVWLERGVVTTRAARNDGRGGFVLEGPSTYPELGPYPRAIRLVDLDLDGDLDAVLLAPDPAIQRSSALLLSEGATPRVLAAAARTDGVSLGSSPVDVDGDGDLDFFDLRSVAENRHLQLSSRRTARVGGALELELAWQPGYGSANVVAVTWIGRMPLATPRAFPDWGLLRLDPVVSFDLPALPLGPDGLARVEVPIPSVPALAGVELFAQSLFAPSIDPTTWRFSGMVRERVLR